MELEKMLRRIHANSANLFHGRSPLFEICNDLILAQSMPSGAVHPNTLCRSSAQSSRWGDDLGADVLGSFGISPIAGPDSVGLLVRIRFHLFLPQRNANRAGSGATRGCGEVATVSARPDIQLTRMEHLAVCDLPGERSIHVAGRRAPGRAAWPIISATVRRRPAHLPTA